MRFLHTADWQIGKPFASIEDPAKRARVQRERIAAVERIGRLAAEHAVAAVLVAGDLFDSTSPDQATVSAACAAIGSIPVPVYAIPGNHDHGGPGGVWEQAFFQREQQALAPNLRLLTAPKVVDTGEALLLPCPLLRRAEALDTTAWLRDAELLESLPAGRPRIVLAHGSVQSFGASSAEFDAEDGAANQIDLRRLDGAAVDYIALGDWHGAKQVGIKAWYSGTPELDRFPKGADYAAGHVLLVSVERGRPPEVQPLATATLGWSRLEHDFSSDPDGSAFRHQVEERFGRRAGEDLLRLHLRGSLGIEAAERLGEQLEALRARLLRLRLVNETVVAPTEEEIQALTAQQQDPLVAEVARQLVARAAAPGEEAAIARIALRELHGRCRPTA